MAARGTVREKSELAIVLRSPVWEDGSHCPLAVVEAACNGSFVLVISRSKNQAQEFFRRVISCYRRLQIDGYGLSVPSRLPTMSELELENGGRILVLPHSEDTIVGYSAVDLLILDEAARIHDAVFYAVRPMLAVRRGRLIALSTPKGQRGFFYKEWLECDRAEKSGCQATYFRARVTWESCPRISSEFAAQEKAKGEHYFRQEFMTEFLPEFSGSPFDLEKMRSLLQDLGED